MEGEGKLTYANGTTYTGGFKTDLKEGKGEEIFENGDRYEGEFKNDK